MVSRPDLSHEGTPAQDVNKQTNKHYMLVLPVGLFLLSGLHRVSSLCFEFPHLYPLKFPQPWKIIKLPFPDRFCLQIQLFLL